MPPGHNGPYHDPETPVRNTSHWLITFLKAYEIDGDARFLDGARRAADYVSGRDARPGGATFWHRSNPRKDSCNGLIGQAWTIEALATAAPALSDARLHHLAESVFMLHPFDEHVSLWQRVDVDGSRLDIDATFNHQLWFAATGSMLLPSSDERLGNRIGRFLDALPDNLSMYPSGAIVHGIRRVSAPRWTQNLRQMARGLLRPGRSRSTGEQRYRKAIGYQAFNLYALAILRCRFREHPFWQSAAFLSALRFIGTSEFTQGLEDNEFGFPYNPPGIEVAYALHVFSDESRQDVHDEMSGWVSRQLRRCYDFENNQMSLGTQDPATHSARLYEATRLPDVPVRLER
jgi:hypothetical protein